MKKALFNSLGLLLLAILSGFSLIVDVVSISIVTEEGTQSITQLVVFAIAFIIIFLLSIYQAIIWFLRFLKAKKINSENE